MIQFKFKKKLYLKVDFYLIIFVRIYTVGFEIQYLVIEMINEV